MIPQMEMMAQIDAAMLMLALVANDGVEELPVSLPRSAVVSSVQFSISTLTDSYEVPSLHRQRDSNLTMSDNTTSKPS